MCAPIAILRMMCRSRRASKRFALDAMGNMSAADAGQNREFNYDNTSTMKYIPWYEGADQGELLFS